MAFQPGIVDPINPTNNQYLDHNNYLTFENLKLRCTNKKYEKMIAQYESAVEEHQEFLDMLEVHHPEVMAQYSGPVTPVNQDVVVLSSSSFSSIPTLTSQHLQTQVLPLSGDPPGVYPPGVNPSNSLNDMLGYDPFESPGIEVIDTRPESPYAQATKNDQQAPSGGEGVTLARDSTPTVSMDPPVSAPQNMPHNNMASFATQPSEDTSRVQVDCVDAMDFTPSNLVNSQSINSPAPTQCLDQDSGAGAQNFVTSRIEQITSYPQDMEIATADPSSANQNGTGSINSSFTPINSVQGFMVDQKEAVVPDAIAAHCNTITTGSNEEAPDVPENLVQANHATQVALARNLSPVVVATPNTDPLEVNSIPGNAGMMDPHMWELCEQGYQAPSGNKHAVNCTSTAASSEGPCSDAAGTTVIEPAPGVNTASTFNNAPLDEAASTVAIVPAVHPVLAVETTPDSQDAQGPVSKFLNYVDSWVTGQKMAKRPKFKKPSKEIPARPWVFGHTFPGTTEYALYYLTCPKHGCPALKNHPLVDGRGAQHIRACGGKFQDEDEMVRKFGTQVAGDRPVITLDWARKWNHDIMAANGELHLASENFPA